MCNSINNTEKFFIYFLKFGYLERVITFLVFLDQFFTAAFCAPARDRPAGGEAARGSREAEELAEEEDGGEEAEEAG